MQIVRNKAALLIICFFLLAVLDQVVLTSPLSGTGLRYSNLTTQKQSTVGFFTKGCSASAHRLTLMSRLKLHSKPQEAIQYDRWKQGSGMLKLPTWGCGLAFYDYGGDEGRLGRMYRWGEGRKGDTWFGQKAVGCGDMTFILMQEAHVLCVSGAEIEKYFAD